MGEFFINLSLKFRQIFCRHELRYEEIQTDITYVKNIGWVNTRVYMHCDKCGLNRWHWKPEEKK